MTPCGNRQCRPDSVAPIICKSCFVDFFLCVFGAPLLLAQGCSVRHLADYTESKMNVFGVPHIFTFKSPNNLAVHGGNGSRLIKRIKRRLQNLKAYTYIDRHGQEQWPMSVIFLTHLFFRLHYL
jgi:hypothetical protein